MGADEPRWFYVGEGELRLKNGEVWTDEYQTIESPRARVTQTVVLEPDPQTLPGTKPKGRIVLWLTVCAALVVLGGTGAAFATGSLKLARLGFLVSASGFGTARGQARTAAGAASGRGWRAKAVARAIASRW